MVYLLILVAFALDRLSKWWAAGYLSQHGPLQLNDYITLRLTVNRGMVFGLAQGVGPLMGWLSLLIIAGLIIYLVRLPRNARLMRVGLALLIGGALGNLVDRLFAGEVLDFITTPLLPWVFNVADLFINGGMAIFVIASFFQQPEKSEPAAEQPIVLEAENQPLENE